VRDPSQAIPVMGSFTGDAASYLGMEVEVTVSSGSQARVPDEALSP
jgi:hypothetical protein